MTTLNVYQQPIGALVSSWLARPLPPHTPLADLYCRLEPLGAARHADALFAVFSKAQDGCVWTYMVEDPFTDIAAHRAYIEYIMAKRDPLQYAVTDARNDRPVDTLALVHITLEYGVAEVGVATFSPLLRRTPALVGAQSLLTKYAFEGLDCQCYEWKCDSLNAPSQQAAQRLSFQFEGVSR